MDTLSSVPLPPRVSDVAKPVGPDDKDLVVLALVLILLAVLVMS